MEIVVTAPTPMIQSPVSEEESDDPQFGHHDAVEKFDDEEMEKSGKEQVPPEPEKPDSDDSSRNNGEVEVILKREHFVERRSSSSESDSEFSLGPRAAIEKPTPAGQWIILIALSVSVKEYLISLTLLHLCSYVRDR